MDRNPTYEELEQKIDELEKESVKRKQSEEALREAYEFKKKIFSGSSMGIATYMSDGQCVSCNEIIGAIIGATREQVLSQNFREIESWKQSGLLADAEEVLSTGVEKTRDIHVVSTFGQTVWLECCFNRFISAGKYHLLLLVDDITERKLAEEALRESEERSRTVQEASPDPIVVYDMTGKVTYVNHAFTKVFGWELKEVWGRKTDFVPEENWHETQRMIDRVEAGESFSGIETRRYTKGGDIVDVSISAAVYRDRNGVPKGSVVNLRDISEQKKLEAQLRQAQKMQAVGRLAAGVAHEINNPLTSILTTAMLLQEDIDPQNSYYLELQTITDQALRCGRIVASLLDFAREAKPAKKICSINDIVNECLVLTRKQAAFNDVTIAHNLSEDIPVISVDKDQIQQALINLVLNAIDATAPGGKITVSTTTFRKRFFSWYDNKLFPFDDAVEIRLSDTGKGIAEDIIANIFDPFFTTKEEGVGLGLSITHGIIEQHGGGIDVMSTPGLGTTLTIRLPINKGDTDTT